jgi:hypothetical protein
LTNFLIFLTLPTDFKPEYATLEQTKYASKGHPRPVAPPFVRFGLTVKELTLCWQRSFNPIVEVKQDVVGLLLKFISG